MWIDFIGLTQFVVGVKFNYFVPLVLSNNSFIPTVEEDQTGSEHGAA